MSEAMVIDDIYSRWLAVKHICTDNQSITPPHRICNTLLHHDCSTTFQSATSYFESFARQRTLFDWRLQEMERCTRLRQLQIYPPHEIIVKQLDYKQVEIPHNSIVYADPPYIGTSKYCNSFNHDVFYDWLRNCDFPVYVSEYKMPDDFIVVAEFSHRTTKSATANNKVVERLFIHKRWENAIPKTTLF